MVVAGRCMDPFPYIDPPGEFPAPNADGTYTLTEEYVQKLAKFVVTLVDYTLEQYTKCGPESRPVPQLDGQRDETTTP